MYDANPALYRAWANMKQRCRGSTGLNKQYYTDKGITVCTAWTTFEAFRQDMERTWFVGAVLDREDGSKNYSVDNCRWVTRTESSRNRSNVKASPEIARRVIELHNSGIKQKSIAAMLKLNFRTVSNIVLQKQWST